MNIRYAMVFIALVMVVACSKFDNITTEEWRPDLAFTLFNTTVNTVDFFESYGEGTELLIDTDQQLTLVYRSNGYSVESRDILSLIPDVTFPMLDTFMKLPYPLPVDIELDFIRAKSGKMEIRTGNIHDEPLEFTFNTPEATLNGEPFNKTVTISPMNTTNVFFPISYDLANYILTPQGDSMIFRYTARLTESDSLVVLENVIGDFGVIVDFVEPVYSYAQGYLGTGSFPIPLDSVEVDFFQYFSDGTVFFEEPKMTIRTRNSFGFPVRAYFNTLNAITVDGETIPFGSQELEQGVDFNYPSINEAGQEAETVLVIDKDNSNIEDIIGQPVIYFEYDVEVISNPDSNTAIISYVTDTSNFYLDAEVELPLYGRADGFTVSDTFDFDIELDDYKNVEEVEFKLVTENEFPTNVDIQVLFTDSNYNIVDRLLDPLERIFESGVVDADGNVTEATRKETFIPIPKDRFNNITQNATNMLVQVKISTFNDGNTSVRVYEDYDMTVKLGIIAGVKGG